MEEILAESETGDSGSQGYKYVGLINNDMFFTPGWLQKLVEFLDANPNAGAVNPLIVYATKFNKLSVKFSGDYSPVGINNDAGNNIYFNYNDHRFLAGLNGDYSNPPTEIFLNGVSFVRPNREGFEMLVPATESISLSESKFELTIYDESLAGYNLNLGGINIKSGRLASLIKKILFKLTGNLKLKQKRIRLKHSDLQFSARDVEIINALGSKLLGNGYPVNLYFGQDLSAAPQSAFQSDLFYGAAALLRIEALRTSGFFDPAYFMYFEESDLAIRLNEAGYQCWACPDSLVYHREKSTRSEKTRQYMLDSEKYFFSKWRGKLQSKR